MRRDGRGGRIAGWAFLLFAAGTMYAGEPVGDAVLEASWVVAPDADPDRRVLRLTVRPLVPLPRWNLLVTSATTYDVRPLAPPEETDFRVTTADGPRRAIRAEMRELAVGEVAALEFEVLFPPVGGGVISFVAEDAAASGRVLAAIGVTARPTGPLPERRLGAIEFPATVLPSPGPR